MKKSNQKLEIIDFIRKRIIKYFLVNKIKRYLNVNLMIHFIGKNKLNGDQGFSTSGTGTTNGMRDKVGGSQFINTRFIETGHKS